MLYENELMQGNLTELKSFGSPPAAVVNVTAAVMVLLAPNGKIPKDKSWKASKNMMAKVSAHSESQLYRGYWIVCAKLLEFVTFT